MAALREHRQEQQRERGLAAELWAPTIDDLVFTTPTGTPVDHRNDYRRRSALLAKAGVRDVRKTAEPR